MKRLFLYIVVLLGLVSPRIQAKDLVVYFSAQGNTQAVAEEIARITGADILHVEAAEPYAINPYDDSDRIQREAYNDLRPGVANLPDAESIAQYDRLFVGSPIWWHQPAMVVCTFLEAYDLSGKVIIPFFTYGATTYLNESMQKIYKVTPNSQHMPVTLPEDLNHDDITTPGPADDAGIDMPGNARGVEGWLHRLGLIGNETAIDAVWSDGQVPFELYSNGNSVQVNVSENMANNMLNVYSLDGTLVLYRENDTRYAFQLPNRSVYLISFLNKQNGKNYSSKIFL